MNKVLLIGRLTKDCELKYVGEENTAVLNFTLAVQKPFLNKDGERDADFIPIVYWKKASEALAPYLKKGKVISIMGRINIRSFSKENGEKKYSAQVVAEQIQFVDLFKHKEKAE